MRCIYTLLFYLALPYIFIRLFWRSRQFPAYRKRLGERFGFYPFQLDRCLWVHAVSMGETIAAEPLIKALLTHYPQLPILVTSMTPTGAARVQTVFGNKVHHVYIPYDLPSAVKRFLQAMRPQAAIIMETELWPNMIAECHQRQIPLALMNARLSEKSARGYRRVASIMRDMLRSFTIIAAHGIPDAERFIALGANKNQVTVTGNIKFDMELPVDLPAKSAQLHNALGEDRFIWIAASTHEGEEEIILAAHKKLRDLDHQALLILVPRHPDRFEAIYQQCVRQFVTARRSEKNVVNAETAVYLGDTMGELLLMYSVADVTFVGGSLIERGGHNILEPAALAKPILSGPHLFNFAEISQLFLAQNALLTVQGVDDLVAQLIHLQNDRNERNACGQRAYGVFAANRGALQKQINLLMTVIKSV